MSELLDSVPDVIDAAQLESWLESRLSAISSIAPTQCLVQIDGAAIAAACDPSPFGLYASPLFRRFAAALFCADLACYETAADRVNFERLLFVLQTACAGFRLFGVRDEAGVLLPVGYTGAYAIDEATFTRLERGDSQLANRLIVPLAKPLLYQQFLYLFNYSIVRPLHKTACSRRLLLTLSDDLDAVTPAGLATITVSADGIRVAERFGMKKSATLTHEGLTESVLTMRR